MTTAKDPTSLPSIAIVGMACRFPGAATIEQFWQNLRAGLESITTLTDEEIDRAAIDPAELRDPGYVRARGILPDIGMFDARCFEMSPREAAITDPQQRIFLECAWEALERAGYDPARYAGAIGVYAGAGANGYLLHNLASAGHLVGTINAFQATVHNKNDHLATRVAYKLNLRGPAITVQTACSTSLVATITACQSLLAHECDVALAGGVTVTVPQHVGYLYTERGIGSPDGHCRAFDARAQGTVGGSGAGVVVLKRLEDAIADGDTIHAVIRGGALNNDGSGKIGYTAPSVDGQAEVVAMAHALAEVDPATISYVEAHGTGTPLGDPIEVQALTQAFRRRTQARQFCALGSVKTNLGHLDTAAGVAGLIKTALALEHRELPPSLHFESPNPEIDFAASPFFVNAELRPWSSDGPRRAGVSSFGLGGTNAHVVLEEAPPRAAAPPAWPHQLLVLSARTEAALEATTRNLAAHLRAHPEIELGDVAFTLAAGRRSFTHRRTVVVRDRADAIDALTTLQPERVFSRLEEHSQRPVTMMFPGQGAQHPNMALALYQREPAFRADVDRCLAILSARGVDLRPALYPPAGAEAAAAEALGRTALTQPALFVISYALARQWMAWGVSPTSLIGHSVGEYVAACLAGVMSLEDALGLVAVRGKLIGELPPGAMLAVPLPEPAVASLLAERGGRVALAAKNGPEACVIAGPAADIAALEAELTGRGLICRRLHTSHAFHSSMMEPALAPFRAAVERVALSAPKVPFLSNVTGTWITAEQATDPGYWVSHIRATVRFAEGLETLLASPQAVLLEVGPGRTLRTIARWSPHKKPAQVMLASLPAPGELRVDPASGPEALAAAETAALLATVGQLWLAGVEVDPAAFYATGSRRRVPLPTYPFERQRHWIERVVTEAGATRGRSLEKRADLASWFYVPTWQEAPLPPAPLPAELRAARWLVLADEHGVGDAVLARLAQSGIAAVAVTRGAPGSALVASASGARVAIDPERPEAYEQLVAHVGRTASTGATVVVHAWGVEAALASSAADGAAAQARAARGVSELLLLTRALGAAWPAERVELTVVTAGTQGVVGADLACPELAAVRGASRVIPREYRGIACRAVDVALADARSPALAAQILAEVGAAVPDAEVALRGGRRWALRFAELPLSEAAGAEAPALRERGVYLVTGGLGGLGLVLADHLAREHRARLVLVGRTGVPERATWAARLAEPATTAERRAEVARIRAIEALEAHGAEVLVCQADVADRAALAAAIAVAQQRFGALHGVIHAAGVAGGGLIHGRTHAAIDAVLAPKVAGATHLAALTAELPLDFVLLCSSLTAVVGRLGQADYAAANAVLDAIAARERARTGRAWIAVDWGAWDDVGMAAQHAASAAPLFTLPHPLLERCLRKDADHEVYATDYNVDRHWVLDEHRILGNPVIPGVAYFEMTRAAFGDRTGDRSVCFEDVFFLAPLRVRDGETREVRLVLDRHRGDETYRFAIRSYEGDGAARKQRDFTVGTVGFAPRRAPRRLDLDAIRRRCNQQLLLLAAEEREEDLGPRWHSVQRVHLGHNEVLLSLELPEAFLGDFDHMVFHPALLDRAAGIAKNFLAREGHYLPLNYHRLTIHEALQRRIYSYAKFREHESADRETICFDIVLMDEHGKALVEIERFTQKRINDPGAEIRALSEPEKATVATTADTERSQEILPGEGAAAFARVVGHGAQLSAARVVVSVRDLWATIAATDEVVQQRILAAAAGRASSDGRRPRPQLATAYVAPRNEIEVQIARAWQDVLGIDDVGIHDNYFELGGDSVQAIQIIAQATKHGLSLSPQQFFQYATIAELGDMLGGIVESQAQQGAVLGPVALAPLARELLDDAAAARDHHRVLLEASAPVDAAHLATAVGRLLAHHDALRLRASRGGEARWSLMSGALGDAPVIATVDLAPLAAADQATRTAEVVAEAGSGLDVERGPLLAVTLIRRGAGRPDLVLVAAHALAVDATSWAQLLPDLERAYRAAEAGEEPRLGSKPTSYRDWAERAAAESARMAAAAQARWAGPPWQGAAALALAASTEDVAAHTAALSVEGTAALRDAAARHRVGAGELIAAALGRAIAEVGGAGGSRAWLVDLARDTRDAIAGLDVGRTVGAFTALQPIAVSAGAGEPAAAALAGLKEQLRGGSEAGLGYAAAGAAAGGALPRASIALAVAASLDDALTRGGRFTLAAAGAAAPHPQVALGRHALRIDAVIAGGQLRLRALHRDGAAARAMVDRLLPALVGAIDHLARELGASAAALAAEDFPLAGIDRDQLAAVAELLGTEEGDGAEGGTTAVPLVPGFHWFLETFDPVKQLWADSLMFESALPLDPGHLRQALVALTHHHDALRLRLARGGAGWQLELRAEDEPGLAPLEVIELGERTDADAERALRDAITASYHQVSIVAGPAIRLALIRRTGHRDRLLMSIHHCAFDNYSLGILFDDFRTALGQVMRGASLALPPTVGYREWASYQVASAGSREIEAEASYWLAEKNLRAYPMPTAKPRIPHYFRDMRIERRALDAERTTAMTALSPQYKGVGIHHLLCAAFARAYCAWSGQPALRLDIEHHGRSGTDAPLSLARTVGSLTTKYPLVIPGGGADAMADLDRALTTLLNVPRQGVGYGLLRYCGRDRGIAGQLAAVPPPDVFFNFLGNVTAAMQAEGFRFMPLERYATPDDIISYALMLNGRIEGGQLTLEWIYSAAMQEPAQMAALADGTLAALAQLMATLQRK